MTAPYLLLGESPNPATANRPDLWLLPDTTGIPHSANRLLAYTGWDVRLYLRIFDRDNLLHTVPKAQGKGRAFPMREARKQVERIFDVGIEYLGIVMLGRRVATAFRWRTNDDDQEPVLSRDVPYFRWHLVADGKDDYATTIPAAICPHPSGVNKWWGSSKNQFVAREFFGDLERFLRTRRGQLMTKEHGHRWRKVAHLLAALYAQGVPIEMAREMGQDQWAIVAQVAGCRAPSTKTVATLRNLIAGMALPKPKGEE